MKRVTVGHKYTYHPAGMDSWDPCTGLRAGDVVEVVKLIGCPPPGTMGHCHVRGPRGEIGLVLLSSLQPYFDDPDGEDDPQGWSALTKEEQDEIVASADNLDLNEALDDGEDEDPTQAVWDHFAVAGGACECTICTLGPYAYIHEYMPSEY